MDDVIEQFMICYNIVRIVEFIQVTYFLSSSLSLRSSSSSVAPSQRPLPTQDNTTQSTNIHALSGIQTHDLSTQVIKTLY
jgi:hypothetical protein